MFRPLIRRLGGAPGFPTVRAGRQLTHSEQGMPLRLGAIPQYVVKAHGTHRTGLVTDLAGVIMARGASVAAMHKVALGTEYALIMHVYSVDGPGYDEDLIRELRRSIGMSSSVEISPLDFASRDAYAKSAPASTWRLDIECAQRTGLVFALSNILGGAGLSIPKIETTTVHVAEAVVFKLHALVEFPPQSPDEQRAAMDIDVLVAKLRGALPKDADVVFEQTTNSMLFELD